MTVQDVNELSRDLLENFGRIRTLVERARCLEKKFDEVPVRSETAMRELVDWGIRRGCFVRGIQLRRLKESTLDEYGVFCTDSLQVRADKARQSAVEMRSSTYLKSIFRF